MFRAAVPETAVYKDCQLRLWENKVGLTEKLLVTLPASDFVTSQNAKQRKLWQALRINIALENVLSVPLKKLLAWGKPFRHVKGLAVEVHEGHSDKVLL